jgi:N utilization substance protein B
MTDFVPELDETSLASSDPRHARRAALMQALFAHTFESADSVELQPGEDPELQTEVELILAALPEIDAKLTQYAPERPLPEVNKVDLAILRLIVYEAHHQHTPTKVLINEAVELAKEFGTETSPKFVNGVLGKLLLEEKPITEEISQEETTHAS